MPPQKIDPQKLVDIQHIQLKIYHDLRQKRDHLSSFTPYYNEKWDSLSHRIRLIWYHIVQLHYLIIDTNQWLVIGKTTYKEIETKLCHHRIPVVGTNKFWCSYRRDTCNFEERVCYQIGEVRCRSWFPVLNTCFFSFQIHQYSILL